TPRQFGAFFASKPRIFAMPPLPPRSRSGIPQGQKALEIAKKTLGTASYKLYYVNYKICRNPPSTDSHTKDLTRLGALCPAADPFCAEASPEMKFEPVNRRR